MTINQAAKQTQRKKNILMYDEQEIKTKERENMEIG